MLKSLPMIGETFYFMNKEVMVIKIWDYFHLVKISDLIDGHCFCVDICTLTLNRDFTNSISLNLFGGGRK